MSGQTTHLQQVMQKFESLDTETLLAEAIIYISSEHEDITMQKAAAAAFGFSRGGLYLDAARSLLNQLLADAAEISWRKEAYDSILDIHKLRLALGSQLVEKSKKDFPSIARLIVGAKYLSKDAELIWHLYSVCLNRSIYALLNAIKWVNPQFSITKSQATTIDLLREFRNHLEHRDEAIQQLSGPDWQTIAKIGKQNISVGYKKTARNEIEFVPAKGAYKGHLMTMPLNDKGFHEIEQIAQQIVTEIRESSLSGLETHFTANPEALPDVETIGNLITDDLVPAE